MQCQPFLFLEVSLVRKLLINLEGPPQGARDGGHHTILFYYACSPDLIERCYYTLCISYNVNEMSKGEITSLLP